MSFILWMWLLYNHWSYRASLERKVAYSVYSKDDWTKLKSGCSHLKVPCLYIKDALQLCEELEDHPDKHQQMNEFPSQGKVPAPDTDGTAAITTDESMGPSHTERQQNQRHTRAIYLRGHSNGAAVTSKAEKTNREPQHIPTSAGRRTRT